MAHSSSVSVEPPRFDRPEVEVRASAKRKKTGTAHWSGSRIVVQIPARLKGKERRGFVDELVERLMAQRPQNAAGDASLEERARVLSELYLDDVRAASVRWVANQRRRWASCSPASREIRVSSRLRQCPEWVIDAVLVHELHSPAFYDLANRHPRQKDCELFLDGFALGLGLRIEDVDVDVESDA
jgi:predicted metal-dependent hydrolase